MKKRNWIFVLLWAALFLPFLILFFISLSNQTKTAIKIGREQFIQMLNEGDLKRVVLVRNQNMVEVTLTEEALNKSEYQNVQELEPFSVYNGPHYKFSIDNAEAYHLFLEKALRNMPSNGIIDYVVEERSDVSSFIMNWGIIFGLIFTIPVLIMWLVFKLFWSTKPKEKSVPMTGETSLKVSELAENQPQNFPVKIGDRTIFLEMNKIVSFQAKDNYVNLLDTEDNIYLIEHTLNELEEKLPQQFIRIHRSYIVNKLLIKEIRKHSGNRFSLHFNSKKSQQLVSSQSYAPKIKEMIKF